MMRFNKKEIKAIKIAAEFVLTIWIINDEIRDLLTKIVAKINSKKESK